MIKAQDCGDYFRIPVDNRDLNYNQYTTEGKKNLALFEEYHSHNTQILDVGGLKKILLSLPIIQKDLDIAVNNLDRI